MDVFQRPQQTIDWAKRSLDEGYQTFSAYAQDDGFAFVTEVDPETGENLLIFRQVKSIPAEVGMHFTNALNNLRNSFDQSLFAVCEAVGHPMSDAHYPWATDPRDLEHRMSGGKKNSTLPDEIKIVIRRQEPYFAGEGHPGGSHNPRLVSVLANDKHTVGFVANATVDSVTLPRIITRGSASIGAPWDSVKKEMIIIRTSGTVAYEHPSVAVDITFDRRIRGEPIPAAAGIGTFANFAQRVLDDFKALK